MIRKSNFSSNKDEKYFVPAAVLDKMLQACKSYIESRLDEFAREPKELAAFERKYMEGYGGNRPIDQQLFRTFLRELKTAVKFEEVATLPQEGFEDTIYFLTDIKGGDALFYVYVDGEWKSIGEELSQMIADCQVKVADAIQRIEGKTSLPFVMYADLDTLQEEGTYIVKQEGNDYFNGGICRVIPIGTGEKPLEIMQVLWEMGGIKYRSCSREEDYKYGEWIEFATYLSSRQLGATNGIATLDASGNVPKEQLGNIEECLPLSGGTLTGKLNANKGLSVTGGNLEVKNPTTGKAVFKVDKVSGATKVYNEGGKLVFEINSDGDVKNYGGDFVINNENGSTILKVEDGVLTYMNGDGYSRMQIDGGGNFKFQDNDNATIIETGEREQYDVDGKDQGYTSKEFVVSRKLRVENDIRLHDGESDAPTMVLDNTDGSIEALNEINSHTDVTCGGTLNSPVHRLSEKADKSWFPTILIDGNLYGEVGQGSGRLTEETMQKMRDGVTMMIALRDSEGRVAIVSSYNYSQDEDMYIMYYSVSERIAGSQNAIYDYKLIFDYQGSVFDCFEIA